MGKDGEATQGQQQQQGQGQKTPQGPPGAAPGASGATGGGTRHKEPKVQPPPPHHPPQILQLTPELFQQTVAAAVTAALTAAQQSQAAAPSAAVTAAAPNAPATVIPRKEKKLAEFWTSRPTMWFRLFDGQFPEVLSEDVKFNALLNHLPSQALPFVDHILRAPDQDPFSRAKACLIKHYEVSPRDKARVLRSLTSLGDRTPTEMLFYMRSLLPGFPDSPLFEAIFIDLLPANARDAAVKHEKMEDMAEAADKVLAEAPATSNITAIADDFTAGTGLAQVARATSTPRKSKDNSLCYNHARYGRRAYRCASPRMCRMRDIVVKPPTSSPAPGNSKAGRQ